MIPYYPDPDPGLWQIPLCHLWLVVHIMTAMDNSCYDDVIIKKCDLVRTFSDMSVKAGVKSELSFDSFSQFSRLLHVLHY